jgi:hypothetical protein
MKEVEWDVTVTIQPVAPPSQGKGYPVGFFEQTYGSCQDDPIVVDAEGIYEEQDHLL